MTICPSCATRTGSRACPILGLELCGICCAERRRAGEPCSPECAFFQASDSANQRRFRAAIRRHGAWLAIRLRAFSESEDALAAALDLEESICAFAAEMPGLADGDVLAALDHLARVAEEGASEVSPGELGSWLEQCLRAAWEQDPCESGLPGLLLLGLFSTPARREVIRKLREIVGSETGGTGYLAEAASYFEDLRSAEGPPRRRSSGQERGGRAQLGQAE